MANLNSFQYIYPTNITDFEHSIVSSLFFEQMPFSSCWASAKIAVQDVQKMKMDSISLYNITQLGDYKSNGVKFRTTLVFLSIFKILFCFCFAFTMWSRVATDCLALLTSAVYKNASLCWTLSIVRLRRVNVREVGTEERKPVANSDNKQVNFKTWQGKQVKLKVKEELKKTRLWQWVMQRSKGKQFIAPTVLMSSGLFWHRYAAH